MDAPHDVVDVLAEGVVKRARRAPTAVAAPAADAAVVVVSLEEQFRDAELMLAEQRARRPTPMSERQCLEAERHFVYIMLLARKAKAIALHFHDVDTLLSYRYRLLVSTELHDCAASGTCTKVSMQRGEPFVDPVTHREVRASGRVFVCFDSGRAHMCSGDGSCPLCSLAPDRSELRCRFGGLSLGAAIMSHQYGNYDAELAQQQRMHDTGGGAGDGDDMADFAGLDGGGGDDEVSSSLPATPLAASTSGKSGRRARARKTPAALAMAFRNDLAHRVRALLFGDELARYWTDVQQRTLQTANQQCDSAVRQQHANTPAPLLWVHALAAFTQCVHKVSTTRPLFGREPRALTRAEQSRAVDYFVQCLIRAVEQLQRSRKLAQLSVDRANLAIGVLYRMRTGYDQTVYYHAETRRVYNDRMPEYQRLPEALRCEERVQFLMPHAFLNVRLPPAEYAKRCQAVRGNITVPRLLNNVTACYCSLLTHERTIDEVRHMRLAELVPPCFLSEDGV